MSSYKIAIIGLGYVGLPLSVEFGKKINTIGYDINQERVEQLQKGIDLTLEVKDSEISKAKKLSFSSSIDDISKCNVYIITVPTPIDNHNLPILKPLIDASKAVGKILSPGDIVIYESTVYPGATEEICVPILEKNSSLKHISSDEINGTDLLMSQHFFTGYSPERINPGDKLHPLSQIVKIVSGSTPEIAEEVKKLYDLIITAGTYKAENIKVAEAAKIIENTQRDLNIALVNELAIIFNMLDIDTEAVLKAAQTKWNFAPYTPGLVGGHCIGVDPYYLTHKAIEVGYEPEMIIAGRRLNDNMGPYVVNQVAQIMNDKLIDVPEANILIMGLTFKENCPDIRNTRVVDLVTEFESFNCNVDVYDPWVDKEEAFQEYGIKPVNKPIHSKYDAILLTVAHNEFKKLSVDQIKSFGKDNHVLYDVKYLLKTGEVDGRL